MDDLRLIFLGTSEFAVPSLKILIENDFKVVAIVTAPDKPKGRGQRTENTPIKEYALNLKLPVLQPTNLKSQEFIKVLKSYHANLQVVVAFRMLPEVIWKIPEYGTFNLHASLLPQYRGAAPINWAIINGEKETGVTTFYLQHKIDTGNIIFQEREPIYQQDTAGTLYERLKEKGAQLVLKTVQSIQDDKHEATPQNVSVNIKEAPKIFKNTSKINWEQSTWNVINFIRGLSPYPASWTTINGITYKIFKSETTEHTTKNNPVGTFVTDNKSYLYFKTADGWISVLELQKEGKRKMEIEEFLMGNKL